MLTTATTQRKK